MKLFENQTGIKAEDLVVKKVKGFQTRELANEENYNFVEDIVLSMSVKGQAEE